MDREFWVYVSNKGISPSTPIDFTTQLSTSVHLDGEWSCGVVEYSHHRILSQPVYLCCDLVGESHAGKYRLPVLRRIHHKLTQFDPVSYIPVKIKDFNAVRIYARTWDNKTPGAPFKGNSYCTLHFRPISAGGR